MHFWCTFKALTLGHRCTCVVFYLVEIWLVRTYYSTSSPASTGPRKGKIPSHITPAILEKQIVLGIEKSQAYSVLINSCQKAKCKTGNTSQMLLLYYHLWHLGGSSRYHFRVLTINLGFLTFFKSAWFYVAILSLLYLKSSISFTKR